MTVEEAKESVLSEQDKHSILGKQLMTMLESLDEPEVKSDRSLDGYISVYERQKKEIDRLQGDVDALLQMLSQEYTAANPGERFIPDWIVMAHCIKQ